MIYLDDLTAGQLLASALWPGNASPQAPRLACRWALVDRASVADVGALRVMDDECTDPPKRDSADVEALWKLVVYAEREPLRKLDVYEGIGHSVADLGQERLVDADKLAFLAAISPIDGAAWVRDVMGPRGRVSGLLGLRSGLTVWFLAQLAA